MTDVLFLPGIIAPVALRYGPLVAQLPGVDCVLKELEVYRDDSPPTDYSIGAEVEAVQQLVDELGLERFHIYGHSGGGAVSLAYAAMHGDRLLSLAVDEPAMDFTDEETGTFGWEEFDEALKLPPAESMRVFMRLQVSQEVELPGPPSPPPPWMGKRPDGIRAFLEASRAHSVDPGSYAGFPAPVYFSRGSRTHPRWAAMQERLERLFPDFTAEVYQGLHHLNTSHQAEPARVAAALRDLWARAEA